MTSEEYETLTQLEERCLKTLEDDVPIAVALMHRIVRELLDRVAIDASNAAEQAQAEERSAVVAWLREWARPTDGYYDMSVRWSVVMEAADIIERGEHRTQDQP